MASNDYSKDKKFGIRRHFDHEQECANQGCECGGDGGHCNSRNTDDPLTESENADKVTKEAKLRRKIEELKKEREEAQTQAKECMEKVQRVLAEFDNFKKRTSKEKECIYTDVVSETVSAFLPVNDSLDRALNSVDGSTDVHESLKEGMILVHKQLKEVFKSLGIEEIDCIGKNFDPEVHNAVMHVHDESVGENVIIEVFQKGYVLNGKVIRYSMVKVAN